MSLLVAFAPLAIRDAHAQTDATTQAPAKKPKKKPKKGAKPEPPPEEAAPAPPPVAPTPPPAPAPDPTPAPTEPVKTDVAPPEVSNNDPAEDPTKSYNFVGLRYRATILPAAMIHLFADGGQTIVTNTIGIEFDHRHDGFSMIPWIVYTSYGTGDMLFHQKGQADVAQYYSDVNSGLKSIYAGVDLLWSVQVAKNLSFEYGAGFGLGFIFGSLVNDWVYGSPAGTLVSPSGAHYAPCPSTTTPSTTTNPSCDPSEHQNSNPPKVNGFVEKNWFGGGSVPVFFPHIAVPDIGLRYKPVKQLELRINTGFSLTGFFFGISGDYGLPDKKDERASAPSETSPASSPAPAPAQTSD